MLEIFVHAAVTCTCHSHGPRSYAAAAQASAQLPEAFAVLGFAFYVQPMLMPLLHEMPPGPAGVRVMSVASCWVVGGVASLVRVCCMLQAPTHRHCIVLGCPC